MSIHDFEIRPLNLQAASEAEYAGFNNFENTMRAELLPEDPPYALAEVIAHWQAVPSFYEIATWAAWEEGDQRIAGLAMVFMDCSGDNAEITEIDLGVLPECRRQGLGHALLRLGVGVARKANRRLLQLWTHDRTPSGIRFLERIGAHMGSEGGENQLVLADVDRGLLNRWMERGAELSREFDFGLWDGPVPEARAEGLGAVVQDLINDEPRDALELQDSTHVRETYREFEAFMQAGRRSWTMYAIHRADDRVAGMTNVVWSPYRPSIIQQFGTGVLGIYRRRGLGGWLKAAMLDKILRELPEAKVIRTGNANSNAPMLKINRQLGFKPFMLGSIWQVETETVEKYLAESAGRDS